MSWGDRDSRGVHTFALDDLILAFNAIVDKERVAVARLRQELDSARAAENKAHAEAQAARSEAGPQEKA